MTAPPPGCVEQRLSALHALAPGERLHDELGIPRAPHAPYSLQLLLDLFRDQYLAFVQRMGERGYAQDVRHQIDKEKVPTYRRRRRARHHTWQAGPPGGCYLIVWEREIILVPNNK